MVFNTGFLTADCSCSLDKSLKDRIANARDTPMAPYFKKSINSMMFPFGE